MKWLDVNNSVLLLNMSIQSVTVNKDYDTMQLYLFMRNGDGDASYAKVCSSL